MTIKLSSKGFSGIKPPKIIHVKGADVAATYLTMLDGTGDYIAFPSSDGANVAIQKKSANGVTLWSFTANAISAAYTNYHGFKWLDTVNKKLYFMVVNTSTSPMTSYLHYVNTDSGIVNLVGSFASNTFYASPLLTSTMIVDRATETSGNFIINFQGTRFEISDTTGVLVSETSTVIDGLSVNSLYSYGLLSPNGKYLIRDIHPISLNKTAAGVFIDRVGMGSALTGEFIPLPTVGELSSLSHIIKWGNTLLIQYSFGSGGVVFGARYYDITDFFRYIDEYLGL